MYVDGMAEKVYQRENCSILKLILEPLQRCIRMCVRVYVTNGTVSNCLYKMYLSFTACICVYINRNAYLLQHEFFPFSSGRCNLNAQNTLAHSACHWCNWSVVALSIAFHCDCDASTPCNYMQCACIGFKIHFGHLFALKAQCDFGRIVSLNSFSGAVDPPTLAKMHIAQYSTAQRCNCNAFCRQIHFNSSLATPPNDAVHFSIWS